MVTTCTVCGHRSVKGDGTKTHHFPPDASLRAQWLSACRLDSVASADRLCGKHFHVDDYKLDSGRLKPGAIPSVFLSSPESRKRPRERSFNVSSSSSSDDSIVSEDGSFSSVKRRKLQASPSKDDLKQKIVEQKRKIKSLNQKLRRKCEKIETLEGMYRVFRKNPPVFERMPNNKSLYWGQILQHKFILTFHEYVCQRNFLGEY